MKKCDIRIALSHCAVLLCLGLVYAWSVFKKPLGAAFSWNDGELTWTFTICMSFFCVGGFLAAKLTRILRHQIVAAAGGALLFLGFFLASKVTSLWQLYLSYGVLVGISIGIIYNCILSAGNAWFANKAGMMSGLFLMCFGAGGLIFGPLCNWLLLRVGWSRTFLYLGVGIFFVVLAGSFQVKLPDGAGEAGRKKLAAVGDGETLYTTADMLKRNSFWLYSVWTILLSSVNMAIVAQVFTISSHIGLADGSSSFMVSLISICCGVGRFVMGTLYDEKGRGLTMNLISGFMLAGSVFLVISLNNNAMWALAIGFVLLGVGYGGITPTNSNFVRKFYGTKYFAMNFSIVNFNLLPSVFIGQLVGSGLYMMTGSYMAGVLVMAAMCAFSLAAGQMIRKP